MVNLRFPTLKKKPALAGVVMILLAGVSMTLAWTGVVPRSQAAQDTSPTAVQLQFPTATETPGPPTATLTRTPTSAGRAVVEAISNETNVRAGPDINDQLMGKIFPGTLYPVVAKRFDWYQIEFPDSPNGTAWVYRDVVTLSGDADVIPELELEDIPTVDPAFVAAQETALFITATPGAAASLTAQVQVTPTGVFTPGPVTQAATLEPGAPLPTFTDPAITNTPVIIPEAAPVSSTGDSGGLPPIVPILALGALGFMGLLVAFLKRL
ncbi:MAG: SH3 domain-containing protein [Anaerolineae bacterium]|nr:SH3 domain-containing protein [Anaerolineae bacterium]